MTVALAVLVAVCTVGVSTLVWGTVAVGRLVAERRRVPGLLSPSMFYGRRKWRCSSRRTTRRW